MQDGSFYGLIYQKLLSLVMSSLAVGVKKDAKGGASA